MRQQAFSCLAATLIGLSATPSIAQRVSEDIHDDVTGPVEMCGIKAEDAVALQATIKRDGRFRAVDSGSPRFELFATQDDFIQWVATRPGEAAHPAVTCRRLYDENGATMMDREMRCDASREACDALFLEFHALDERVRAELGGR